MMLIVMIINIVYSAGDHSNLAHAGYPVYCSPLPLA